MKKIYTPKRIVSPFKAALLLILFIGAFSFNSSAQIVAAQSGNWSDVNTWVGGVVPGAADNVQIGGGFTVTVDATAACTDLMLGDGAATGTLSFNSGITLTSTGTLTIGNGGFAGNINMAPGGTLSTAMVTVSTAGTWNAGAGTVVLTGSFTIDNTFFSTFNNLTINAVAGTVLEGSGLIVGSSLNISAGIFDLNGFNMMAGDVSGSGAITDGSTTSTLTDGGDNVSTTFSGIISGASLALIKNGSGALTLSGANTYAGGTTLSDGQLNINNVSAIGTGVLTINGGTTIDNTSGTGFGLSTNNAQTWNGSFTYNGSQSLDMGTGAITLGGNVTITLDSTFVFKAGGTINDNVNSLTVNGTGQFDLGGQTVQLYSLSIGSALFYTNSSNISLKGNFTNSGFFGAGTGAVILNGSSTQSINGTSKTSFYDLTLNNASGVLVNTSETVNDILTLTSGRVTLGADTLTLGTNGSISGASTTNYIITNSTGTLSKVFTAAGTFSYPVGDNNASTDYTPVSLNVISGSFPGTINVLTSNTKAPTNKSSVNYLNRYWRISESNLGIFSCAVTGNYLAGDVAGTESSIAGGLWPGLLPWNKYTVVNTGTHQVSATVSAFGDITGITLADPTVSITPTSVCLSSPFINAVTTGDDPSFTYSWSTAGTSSAVAATSTGVYSVTVTDGNGITGSYSTGIVVNSPVVALTSAVGTDGQELCTNSAIADITYGISGGATGAIVSALPAGVIGSFSSGSLTISGTPTTGGVYTYTVTSTGGPCGPAATANGTITVDAPSLTLTSASGTDVQIACNNTPITSITYSVGGSATGATITGLPPGVSSSFSSGVLTISGIPTDSGKFVYSISTTGGSCGSSSANGTLTIGAPLVALSSSVGTDGQTLCPNTTITDITYTIGGTATGAVVTGLPSGVNGSFSSGQLTISGAPLTGGVYTYTVNATGGPCFSTDATGTITVNSPGAILVSAVGTDGQTVCAGTPIINIKYALSGLTTGINVSGLPSGVNASSNNDTLTISGTPAPTDTSIFSYTVFTTTTCGNGSASGTITIGAPFVTLSSTLGSDAQSLCVNNAISNITYGITGNATGGTVTGLPAGVSFGFNAGTLTISGTPTAGGVFTYTVATTGGPCSAATVTGVITVNAPSVTLISATGTDGQTICLNSSIVNVSYVIGGSAITGSVSGLPAGLNTAFSSDTLTISGTPSVTGSYTYTVSTGGGSCGTTIASGTITINSPSISLTSAVNSDNQTLCAQSPINNITYSIGGGATGSTVAGLPLGLTYSNSGGNLTITGTPKGSGVFTYTVTTTGSSCGSVTANGSITVILAPTLTVTGSHSVMSGVVDTLIASGATSYTWTNIVSSDTDIVVVNSDTSFTVTGTGPTGCSDTLIFNITLNVVGISNVADPSTTYVYPNPAFDVLNLSFDMHGEKTAVIKLIDIMGKEVMSTNTTISNSKIVTMDISTLPVGMYFARIITNNNTDVVKFMKQ